MMLAILQARMGSSRLPGKVLMPILGRPMLELELERLGRARCLDKIIVATSDHPADEPIAALADRLGLECFRGSQDDVLDRYYQAARRWRPRYVARITGDCPLIDPALVDRLADFFLEGGHDLACNTIRPTFPDGLDAWVMTFEALENAWRNAVLPSEREHVTQYIQNRPRQFKLGNLEGRPDLSHLRWTVDEPEDLLFARQVYQALYPRNPAFTTQDVLDLLAERPALGEINQRFARDEGLLKSLEQDRRWLDEHATDQPQG
ncbi:acylneuraminate cytidylyltransferase [Desulfarculus baarsii DSM 2075]|uniref:Acylneuraminate cytidylyltransferase n=1 Tax=Desulfarculus baarsii (strain ATCC 33931 / DSM 2075 / LMG 7858 / VKM B-1802 / 2st14) TaxID=644282 RepID=E1QFQ6_DESB2|nr:glycosyltransferase family protein [Desulfarculus baarsii]ADK84392.1 acylneuraminate cytidylyltransferase [Desulfarculus baarsii DSM 2075]